MLASLLMAVVGGQRAMTPLATVAVAAACGKLPVDNGAPRFLAHPFMAAGAMALAAGEMAGDKREDAPDRTAPAALGARFATSALAGAALAPRRQRGLSAMLGGFTAVAAAFAGWRVRTAAEKRFGRTAAAFGEDLVVLAGAVAIGRGLGRLPDTGCRRRRESPIRFDAAGL